MRCMNARANMSGALLHRRGVTLASALLAGMAVFLMLVASAARAASEGPQWTVTSVSRATNFAPGDETGDDAYVVTVTNTGGSASDGSPIVITDELPAGLSPDPAGASVEDELALHGGATNATVHCVLSSCSYTGALVPDDTLRLVFPVDVSSNPPGSCPVPAGATSCVTNTVRISGGGAPAAGVETPTTISTTPASFGIAAGGASTALSSLQAGAHPDLTTAIAFNTVSASGELAGDPKDTTDNLPPGFAGDLVDTPSCPAAEFLKGECAIGTQVGVTTLDLASSGNPTGVQLEPVYNLTPGPGEVAKLGFSFGAEFFYEGNIVVRPEDYGLQATFHNATEGSVELDSVSLTIWGVPADPTHNAFRFEHEPGQPIGKFGVPSDAALAPYFTNPTSCGKEQLVAMFLANSWESPEESSSARMPFGPLVGCDRLTMEPDLSIEATTNRVDAPSGLALGMHIPQTYESPEGYATSTLQKAVVTLPEGMTVNPSAGAGLGACTVEEYAEEAIEPVSGRGCPEDSKLGSVSITTPSLKEEATGAVYIAQPYDNQFGSLLALYIVARIPNRGVIVKAAGEVAANPLTGQLVTTFNDLPPLPFTTFKFQFHQGETSPLVTPPTCGAYTTTAALTPASEPESAPLTPVIPPLVFTTGFEGGQCPAGTAPFAPQVLAGTLNNAAGSYSPLYVRIIRNDGEQEITGLSTQLPAGLTANLTGVPFCPEADIALARTKSGAQEEAEPSCPAASQIGHTLVGAGVGSVLAWTPGRLYMAGPFEGAPFSIVAITSAKVGPFDLGTVVVHLPLQINPETAAVSVGSGAADQIPHIIKGIVVHVRDIRVYVERPDFTLNPTNCAPMTLSATVVGSGASFTNSADDVPVAVNEPFEAADCQSLAFKPSFTAATSGTTSKAHGASLKVKLTYPTAPQGSQANIRSVKVDLPIQLPSRLSTLQKACRDTTFDVNPASCPGESVVGEARAVTPILPVPLIGPAYFVSHGGAKFPELVVVLQGYGVTIELHGETLIKNGVTSSTFRLIPDQPVTSFELTLPEGPYSALAAYGSLCSPTRTVLVRKTVTEKSHGRAKRVVKTLKESVAEKLVMPTAFTAQNGLIIHQNTPIVATGCAKATKAKKATQKAKAKKAKTKKA
jgi:uncharacterized repeat protein (TIGR01451 family)